MKIVFCLPGKEFSGRFLECWSNLLTFCLKSGLEVYMRRQYSSNVFTCRNMCLNEGTHLANEKPRVAEPLEKTGYDFVMWIDSDQIFEPPQFRKLVDYNLPIVGGYAVNGPGGQVACGQIRETGHLDWYTLKTIKEAPTNEVGLIKVDFTGFAFLLVKKGVFESIGYPWFRYVAKQKGDKLFYPSEDIAWSTLATDKGWEILIDPEVKVGHEKLVIF